MSDLYLIFKNLTRKKLRLFLTMFATFIAFLIYGTITSFQAALDAGVELSADDRLVSVNKINFTQPLPISYVNKVRGVAGVEEVVHMNWFGGYYQDPRNQVQTFAVDKDTLLGVYTEIILTDEEEANWLQNRQAILVGESIARTNGWKVGDRLPLNSNIFSQADGKTVWQFDIVGVYTGADAQTDTNSVYIHYKYFNETQSFGGNYIGWMGVKTASPDLNEQVIKSIDDLFVNSPFETETVPEKAFQKAFIEQIGNIGLILTSVIGAAFFIILVIVGNSMVLAVRERTAEIGVMKTLGFKSVRIFRMVLGESMLLALMGGGLGLLASLGMIGLMNSVPAPLPTLIMDADVVLKAVGVMLALGLITGIIPAVSALRLNIITALSRG
ncbi:MAG: ABC transporter permease [Kordiimonadales bacterium]|nr:MAG: ABC transporter permease [Kordiimonadales bacterium]